MQKFISTPSYSQNTNVSLSTLFHAIPLQWPFSAISINGSISVVLSFWEHHIDGIIQCDIFILASFTQPLWFTKLCVQQFFQEVFLLLLFFSFSFCFVCDLFTYLLFIYLLSSISLDGWITVCLSIPSLKNIWDIPRFGQL